MKPLIGQSLRRKEDERLLTGRGAFSDDVGFPGQTFAVMVRSPHAHARLRAVATEAARAVPGVLAVLTGRDARADGLKSIPHNPLHSRPSDIPVANRDGSPIYVPAHFALPDDKARFVGEAVAMVVAETIEAARDGAERVAIDWEVLGAVTATVAAAGRGAARVFEDRPSNLGLDADIGDRAATEAGFAKAAHIARLDTTLARVTGVPLEPRAAVAAFDPATGRYTIHAGSGGTVRHKREIAHVLGVPLEAVRVLAQDVGGNYGTRNALYPEFPLVAWAARRVGRPVKWTADRTECLLTDYQARDLVVSAALAFDADGRILALRSDNLSNIGAYAISYLPLIKGIEIMNLTYRIPAAFVRARAVLSNTPPTYPYRSAGRPEVVYVIERLIDRAARALGLDRAEIRRRNLIPRSAVPYDNRLGMTYDSGDFPFVFETAARLGDWTGFAARRRDAAGRGRLRGIGIANYIDLSTGAPVERAEIDVVPSGRLDVVMGTQASGQGHETSFGQVVADLMEVPFDAITLITGDTDVVKAGGGTHSGRSMRMGAIVLSEAAREVLDKGRRIASVMLEAAVGDIGYGDGRFRVVGTDRSVGLFEVAAAARTRADLPAAIKGPLRGLCQINQPIAAFGNGCHVCEVEVDPDTGVVEIARYSAVDDVGRAINPLTIDGQTHGGIAQGFGQALQEHCVYEPATGQMTSATFMDYAMPRADQLPNFVTEIVEVPAPTNPLGVKPGSEGGTAPSPAVITNAIVDALSDLGVDHVELPASPERVWHTIQAARARG
ncbi:MAG: xanthine dehydrogenase family protein molybdopterin-binding subunit [Alphaproteobacteria bacterium]|nr:xanthine dehydrogenase family protein molybdopterin-binding subunit [Alphaproteobacteria bacterium]